MRKGMDISAWQEEIDFSKAKADVDYAIIREGYRKTIDKYFLANVKGCKANGIEVHGVYHFIYATNKQEAIEEADSCIKNFKAAGLDKSVRIWADLEYDTIDKAKAKGIKLTAKDVNALTIAFCERIKECGYKTGIYTNCDYYRNMYTAETLSKYPIWLADYSGGPDYGCIEQQYTSSGKVAGISGTVDMNYCFEDDEKKEPAFTDKADALDPDAVIAIALQEEGYHEKNSPYNLELKTASNDGSGNYTKYGKEMHSIYPAVMDYPAAWCDAFVDWCFYKAFGNENAKLLLCGSYDDYTVQSAAYYKAKGRYYKTPKRGDQVFFRNSSGICHTGIVVNVANDKLYTIEGNSSNMVRQRSYALTDSTIDGYGRPNYGSAINPAPSQPVTSGKLNTTPKWVAEVTADLLNVRSWAGTEFANIKAWPQLGKGNLVDVCDNVTDSKGSAWYYIRIAGRIYGFVHSKYIRKK